MFVLKNDIDGTNKIYGLFNSKSDVDDQTRRITKAQFENYKSKNILISVLLQPYKIGSGCAIRRNHEHLDLELERNDKLRSLLDK